MNTTTSDAKEPEQGEEEPPKRRHKKKRLDGKPKKPLSAYNFFFRDERKALLSSTTDIQIIGPFESQNQHTDQQLRQGTSYSINRSRSSSNSNSAKPQKDDSNSSSSIGMSFQTMTKIIGERWTNLTDPELKQKYIRMAEHDAERYSQELKSYRDSKRSESSSMMHSRANTRITRSTCVTTPMIRNQTNFPAALTHGLITTEPTSSNDVTMRTTRSTTNGIIPSPHDTRPKWNPPAAELAPQRFMYPPPVQHPHPPPPPLQYYYETSNNSNPPTVYPNQDTMLSSHPRAYEFTETNMSSRMPLMTPPTMRTATVTSQHQHHYHPTNPMQNIHLNEEPVHEYQHILNDSFQLSQVLSMVPRNGEERQLLLLQLLQLYHISKSNDLKIEYLLLQAMMMNR